MYTTRSVVFFWCWLGLILVYSMRVNLSVAIVPMQQEYHWTNNVKGFVLGSFFIGYVVGQIPGGYLATKYGAKWVFGIGVLSTALLTLLLPWSACGTMFCPQHTHNGTSPSSTSIPPDNSHILSLDLLRVLMGMFESVTYPSLMALLSQWAPPNERGRIVSLTFSGAQIGTAIAFPLATYISSQQKTNASDIEKLFERWPGVFYVFGVLGVLWFAGWSYFVSSSPINHPRISQAELDFIKTSQQEEQKERSDQEDEQLQQAQPYQSSHQSSSHQPVPPGLYYALMTNSASLSIMLNHFTNNWSLYLMLTWMPSYVDKMLPDKNHQPSGTILFVPYLAMAVLCWGAGWLADWLIVKQTWSKRSVRLMMQLTGNLIPAAAFLLLGFTRERELALVVMIVAVSTSGFAYPGYSANCLDICPKYTGILYSLSNTIATVPGIVAPVLAGMIVKTPPTFAQWQIVFGIAAGLYIVGNVFYVKYCQGHEVKELNP